MDDKHNNLDDFLRDQLNDGSENPSWNVPGDHVFENAINALPEKKKNNRRGWIILPLLFLVVFIGREYMHLHQVNKLETKITSLEESASSQSSSNLIESDLADNKNSSLLTIESEQGVTALSALDQSNTNSSAINIENSLTRTSSSTSNNSVDIKQKLVLADPINNKGIALSSPHIRVGNNLPTINLNPTKSSNQSSFSLTSNVENQTNAILDSEENSNTTMGDAFKLWITPQLYALPISGIKLNFDSHEILVSTAPNINKTRANKFTPMRYGVLIGGNQSWLTMKNIPANPNMKLYDYDNNQSGSGAYAFIEKPLSNKLSIQAGMGYQQYRNQSVLEDQFLFDNNSVTVMPDGTSMYQTSIDVINPLGDYSTMLSFRISDQMEENDIIKEYTSMKQKLNTVHFDLSLGYKILSLDRFDFSLGAGLGVGYLGGLKNEYSISGYHNAVLQSTTTENPNRLSDSQKWYGQAIGKINITYHLTDHLGLLLESQYRGGINRMRRGTEDNGSQTYIHAFTFSAGLSHSF